MLPRASLPFGAIPSTDNPLIPFGLLRATLCSKQIAFGVDHFPDDRWHSAEAMMRGPFPILVIDAQMPIRARRIKYFEDPKLKALHVGQAGSFPYPDEDQLRRDRQLTETRATVEKLRQELKEVKSAGAAMDDLAPSAASQALSGDAENSTPIITSLARGRAARAAASAGITGRSQLKLNLGQLGIGTADRAVLASAVRTTRSIIEEFA